MLPADFFAGWTRHPMADGFILVPAAGLAAGPIRVRHKQPLVPLRRIIDQALAESGRAVRSAAKVGALERLVTVEGEHAGLATIEMRLAGDVTMERTIALVAGDDHGTVIDGATARPEELARYRGVIRGLAASCYLGLGELRRRRYAHAVPTGWIGMARPYVTTWLAPGFPRAAATIRVFEARPHATSPAEVDDRALSIENLRVGDVVQRRLRLANGLSGALFRGEGASERGPIVVLRAHLEDDRFLYLSELQSDAPMLDEAVARYEELVHSIQPIPRRQLPPASSARHWLD